MSRYIIYDLRHDLYLMHHGIKGQKWGERNGPPYPLGSEDHSVREKRAQYIKAKQKYKVSKKAANRAYSKAQNISSLHPVTQFVKGSKAQKAADKAYEDASLKAKMAKTAYSDMKLAKQEYRDSKNERSTKDLSLKLGISEKEAEKLKKYAKIVGISLATTAGLVAAGYLVSRNRTVLSSIADDILQKGKTAVGLKDAQIITGINRSGSRHAYSLRDIYSFRSQEDIQGYNAFKHGYEEITADFIKEAIKNPTKRTSVDLLINDVRINQVCTEAPRRLSCWSTAQAYYLSSLTGKDFCSMSFENLVDFNDFNNLYIKQPTIFDFAGNKATDFVGKFGRSENRIKFDETKGLQLINSIFDNIGTANNKTADGSKTIGFINAAYRGITCTHQWNFEVVHAKGGSKILNMVDGYEGLKYTVATRSAKGVTTKAPIAFDTFMDNLYHYNADSLRYYAPTLDSINPYELSKFVLGKK